MQTSLLADIGGQRTYAIVLESGDEVLSSLKSFVEENDISASQFSAIGAFEKATLAYFDWQKKDYHHIPVEEQVEVASLTGDVALGPDERPAIHIHSVLGRRDGSALAGHLIEAHVRPTLEIVLTESPAHLRKRHDPQSGLTLIRPEA